MPRITSGFKRQGPEYRFGDQTDFHEIKHTFGFKTITIGSWVTPTEQRLGANLIYDALADLAQILQVPPFVIGLKGTLNFALGTGGQLGVQAHYNASTRTLALAKNAGAGALAHEWWHAFDHYICKHVFSHSSAHSFASSLWLQHPLSNNHPLNLQLAKFFKMILLSSKGDKPSQFFEHAKQLDSQYGLLYFSLPQELSARAFESCIAYNTSISNEYLVSGVKNSELQQLGGFPDLALNTVLSETIFDYFKALGIALHHHSG
ncbi:hypothetical protein HG263_00090 [Pseudoalteromonas sp. JBTF-M23]|uniref:Large polyvalent protein-associated domain-containing protein n=1 Tax=Pseudoalteromonas caenipelagi TaxID=2726988 RepID=A0A849V7N8_9GAMM|nr:hypothetical protein [Pseudoalteromonas caenipelagi]